MRLFIYIGKSEAVMGEVVQFKDAVTPMDRWRIDLDHISPFEEERYVAQLMQCPEPDCKEVVDGLRYIALQKTYRRRERERMKSRSNESQD